MSDYCLDSEKKIQQFVASKLECELKNRRRKYYNINIARTRYRVYHTYHSDDSLAIIYIPAVRLQDTASPFLGGGVFSSPLFSFHIYELHDCD